MDYYHAIDEYISCFNAIQSVKAGQCGYFVFDIESEASVQEFLVNTLPIFRGSHFLKTPR